MTRKEYEANYQRIFDNLMIRSYDRMMNMVHVVTIKCDDPIEHTIIPALSVDCMVMNKSEKINAVNISRCISHPSMTFDKAIKMLGSTYVDEIQNYMDYGRFMTPVLFPVQYYELKCLTWIDGLDSDIVCLCQSEDKLTYNIINVGSNGIITRTNKDGDKMFEPDDFDICFLIDLDSASSIEKARAQL